MPILTCVTSACGFGNSTVPCSSQRYHSVRPPVSHHRALMRSRFRLTNRNSDPSVTLLPSELVTMPVSPSNPFRKSTGSVHR